MDPTDVFELVLQRKLFDLHSDRLGVFHAAAFEIHGTAWVLCGPSGAGKSSLSLAALARGFRYYTDEFVVTNGTAVWGWPRTPQFGAPDDRKPLPDWLISTEPADEHGTRRRPVPRGQVARDVVPAQRVHVVSIGQGPRTLLEPISATMALRCWHEAAFFSSPVSLGRLVGLGRTWRAQWRHPDELLDTLETVALQRQTKPLAHYA